MDRLPPILAVLAGATAISALLALLVWLGITTAGTLPPFDADPAVIAMGVPSHQHPPRPAPSPKP